MLGFADLRQWPRKFGARVLEFIRPDAPTVITDRCAHRESLQKRAPHVVDPPGSGQPCGSLLGDIFRCSPIPDGAGNMGDIPILGVGMRIKVKGQPQFGTAIHK